MAKLTRTAEMSTTDKFTASDMLAFLDEIPADAEIEIKIYRGDPRDPREASYRETKIKATWTE